MGRIAELQQMVRDSEHLHINSDLLDYAGIIEYHPEELIITVKAGTKIFDIQSALAKNGQILPFFIKSNHSSIGATYANGGQDLSDSVLGVKIIDGTGALLNFGAAVMKNVAGYDVARLLVGSKGNLAMIVQISFKVIPKGYFNKPSAPKKHSTPASIQKIEAKLAAVFDPRGIFQ